MTTGDAGIGYFADGNFFENHALANSDSSISIACGDNGGLEWANIIYQLDYRGTYICVIIIIIIGLYGVTKKKFENKMKCDLVMMIDCDVAEKSMKTR